MGTDQRTRSEKMTRRAQLGLKMNSSSNVRRVMGSIKLECAFVGPEEAFSKLYHHPLHHMQYL